MNFDDDDRSIPANDYRRAWHLYHEIGKEEARGIFETMKGNERVPVDLPEGYNETVGSYEDVDNNSVIWLLFNEFTFEFTDNYFVGGKVGFIGPKTIAIRKGDTITVEQDPGYEFDNYNGEFKVAEVDNSQPNSTIVVTDQDWLGNTPANPGTLTRNYHTIYRLFRKDNTVHKVVQHHKLGFKKGIPITEMDKTEVDRGDELFYWATEYGYPKKVNLTKADNTGKKWKHKLFFDKTLKETFKDSSKSFGIELQDEHGDAQVSVQDLVTIGSNGESFNQAADQLAAAINSNTTLNELMEADGCGEYVEVTYKSDSTRLFINMIGDANAVPINFYPEYNDHVLNQAKAPLACSPEFELKKDNDFDQSLIEGRYFQFATRLVMDDWEETVLSPHSKLSLDFQQCSNSRQQYAFNFIRIDFTDERLNDPEFLNLIRRVDVLYREGDENIWSLAESLEQHQVGVGTNFHDFYNNSNKGQLAQSVTNRNFDAVPEISRTQELIKNNLFHGDVTEGKDNICIDADVDVQYREFDEPEDEDTFTITALVEIHNPFLEGDGGTNELFGKNQPIHQEWKGDYDTPVFGGLGNTNIKKNVGSNYDQYIPLGGFVGYLAGTDFYGISNQEVPGREYTEIVEPALGTVCPSGILRADFWSGSHTFDAPIEGSQVTVDVSPLRNVVKMDERGFTFCGVNSEGLTAIRKVIRRITDNTTNVSTEFSGFTSNDNQIYSKIEIKGVPKGKYVLRLGSHLTTEEDLKDSQRRYQRYSTQVIEAQPEVSYSLQTDSPYEIVVEAKSSNAGSNGEVYAGNFIVADLTDPRLLESGLNVPESTVIKGYLVNNFFNEQIPADWDDKSLSGIESAERIELAEVKVDLDRFLVGSLEAVLAGSTSDFVEFRFRRGRSITDHNGYFFNAISATSNAAFLGLNKLDIESEKSGIHDCDAEYYDYTGQSVTPREVDIKDTARLILFNSNQDVSQFSRTKITGNLLDPDGNGVGGANVITTRGNYVQTDFNGTFNINIYAPVQFDPAQRGDFLIFTLVNSECRISFSEDFFAYGVVFSQNYYNHLPIDDPDSQFLPFSDIGTLEASYETQPIANAMKRGWDGMFGLVYMDDWERHGAVQTDSSLEKHIFFYTEKDKDGNVKPDGKPVLNWEIRHLPPDDATHYHWVRTKNTQLSDWFMFAVNKVVPRTNDFDQASFNNADVIELDLTNIADFQRGETEPGRQVKLSGGGDLGNSRVRFYRRSDGDLFEDYIDLPVVATTNTNTNPVVRKDFRLFGLKPGSLVEIYSPKQELSGDLFYEWGECFRVEDGVHKGNVQDQKVWEFDDNFFHTGNLGFVGELDVPFSVGDEVYVEQYGNFVNSSYEGKAKVQQITSSNRVVLDKGFGANTPPNPGRIILPAKGQFTGGDSYYRNRRMSIDDGLGFVSRRIESSHVSDFYDSRMTSIGRVHAVNKDARKIRRPAFFRHSREIFPKGRINGLNTFYADEGQNLQQEDGTLAKLIAVENVLLAWQRHKITTIYVKEDIVTYQDGTSNLITTDDVIGKSRGLQGKYGTINRESVVEYEGYVWGWDATTGNVVRYSKGGLFPISSMKAVSYFHEKHKLQLDLNDENFKVLGMYDPFEDKYILSFPKIEKVTGLDLGDSIIAEGEIEAPEEKIKVLSPKESIGFSESAKRWTSFYDLVQESWTRSNGTVVTFKDGEPYIHHSDEVPRLQLYGEKVYAKLSFVHNNNRNNKRVLKSFGYDSTDKWEVDEIIVPNSASANKEMKSRLKENKFKSIEGEFWSEILRDMNDPKFSTPVEALLSGKELRGHTATFNMRTDKDGEVRLFAVTVISESSSYTNQKIE